LAPNDQNQRIVGPKRQTSAHCWPQLTNTSDQTGHLATQQLFYENKIKEMPISSHG
jgi:hypothetical protein